MLASWAAYTGTADYVATLRGQAVAVTASDLQQAASWLDPRAIVTVVGR